MRPYALMLALAWWANSWAIVAEETNRLVAAGPNAFVIDLPTTLQLAGTRNLDVQIVRAKLADAKANHEIAVGQFFPAIIPGVGYRRHDDLIQDVVGNIIDVHKDSYTLGPTLAMQLDLGDAIYKTLLARQLVSTAEFALETQRRESELTAARGYFDLAKAQGALRVAADSVRIAEDFADQVRQAVGVGIAFKGDALRAEVQADRNRISLRQAQEQVAQSAARLVRTLHLGGTIALATSDDDLVPLTLTPTNAALDAIVAQALAARPEIKQSRAQVETTRIARNGAKYAPLVPSLGAQVFAGGLGGGVDGGRGRFGASEDYQFTLGWRLGPGGLLDRGRIRASEARLLAAQLTNQKLSDEITREVVESLARIQSLSDQLSVSRHAMQVADEGLRLASQRKEFAVGAVLERIQTEQDLTRTRLDYLNTVAEFNKAQFEFKRAMGETLESTPSHTIPK